MSEHCELARGGCGAGRQRTIAADHAEVDDTVIVAELGDAAAVDGARLSGVVADARVARERINKPEVTRAQSGSELRGMNSIASGGAGGICVSGCLVL